MAEGGEKKITCFSNSQIVSSDTLFLHFFTWLMLLLLTFLRASLDLLVDCLASLARLSLCSLVTLAVEGKKKHQKEKQRHVLHIQIYFLQWTLGQRSDSLRGGTSLTGLTRAAAQHGLVLHGDAEKPPVLR